MERTIFTNGLVFDGSGSPAAPGEVTVEADRVVSVTPGWSAEHRSSEHSAGRVIDVTGCTVMPGLIESHAPPHLPVGGRAHRPVVQPAAGRQLLPPHRGHGGRAGPGRAERRILLDAGLHLGLLGRLAAADADRGHPARQDHGRAPCPGPRLRAASMERDNHPVRPDGHVEPDWQGPDACRAFVREQAAHGLRQREVPAVATTTCSSRAARRSPSTPRRRRPPRASRPASPGSG